MPDPFIVTLLQACGSLGMARRRRALRRLRIMVLAGASDAIGLPVPIPLSGKHLRLEGMPTANRVGADGP
ncbi:MAG: hypothetical protein ACJ8G3_03040 [Burkholderiaceae bacterium]